ncbi:sigma-70 family RNA polymerase sigma factor [Anaerobacillus alkaliphilus]|uniref:Sigma-70 family RNA polymerase sigma factor n=1 Tax=Anaerobacillus alkaliphilus TaxID=1548597 RepID=A0A4Q0W211_9BACI|nr:sigma-70 family RNA polymerase sigma factor [Anaerobacillus alkaliphilus]RXJ04581.1 sigma-70 family RNA polymerase sigma factor [Anaerobacillus alkaliphilus]
MKINDQNFIDRLKCHDEDALDFIIDKYLPLIKGVTYKVLSPLHNKGVIEECVNDIILSIWNNATKFQGAEAHDFRNWVCAIAKFKAIDYYRKYSRNVEISSEYMEVIEEENSAEDELILQENREELVTLLNHLEPVDREIFIMKYFLGLKSSEIAKKLNLTKASIANRIYRGKKTLNEKSITLMLGESRS